MVSSPSDPGAAKLAQAKKDYVEGLIGALEVTINLAEVRQEVVDSLLDDLKRVTTSFQEIVTVYQNVEDVRGDVKRVSRVTAVLSALLAVGCLIASWRLDSGFWFIFFSAAGAAFLTYVLVDFFLEYRLAQNEKEAEAQEQIASNAFAIAGVLVEGQRKVNDLMDALPKVTPELPPQPPWPL